MASQNDTFGYTTFFEGLATRIRTLKELRNTYCEQMAFDFIATRFFQPGENKFSEILAFFLDPKETHGQGNKFLRIFCEKFLGTNSNWKKWLAQNITVETEHITDRLDEDKKLRRIDIVIRFGNEFIVGIENKIGAGDQPEQVKDYCEYMRRWKGKEDNFLCLYLTTDGSNPSKESIEQDGFNELRKAGLLECISYQKHIDDLLEQWVIVCKAPAVEAFIKDFRKYIQYIITGVHDMAIDQGIQEYITRDDYMETALLVWQNIDHVKKKLWSRVCDELKEYLKNEKSTMLKCSEWNPSDWLEKDFEPLIIEHENWRWALSFDTGSCRDIYQLIYSENQDFLKNVKERLSFGWINPGNTNDWLPNSMYRTSWLTSIDAWQAMVCQEENGRCRFTNQIIECYERAKEAIEEIQRTK